MVFSGPTMIAGNDIGGANDGRLTRHLTGKAFRTDTLREEHECGSWRHERDTEQMGPVAELSAVAQTERWRRWSTGSTRSRSPNAAGSAWPMPRQARRRSAKSDALFGRLRRGRIHEGAPEASVACSSTMVATTPRGWFIASVNAARSAEQTGQTGANVRESGAAAELFAKPCPESATCRRSSPASACALTRTNPPSRSGPTPCLMAFFDERRASSVAPRRREAAPECRSRMPGGGPCMRWISRYGGQRRSRSSVDSAERICGGDREIAHQVAEHGLACVGIGLVETTDAGQRLKRKSWLDLRLEHLHPRALPSAVRTARSSSAFGLQPHVPLRRR